MKMYDTATKLEELDAKALYGDGIDIVARYLVPNSGSLAWKALTKEEIGILEFYELDIIPIYESSANRANSGFNAGYEDAGTAYHLAEANELKTSVLFFAVDFEPTDAELDNVREYFKGISNYLYSSKYKIGVYGCTRVCKAVEDFADYFWQCTAWSYGSVYEKRAFFQTGESVKLAGTTYDVNEVTEENLPPLYYKDKRDAETEVEKMKNYSEESLEAFELCKNLGIFKGDENGEFHWEWGATREELALVIARLYAII